MHAVNAALRAQESVLFICVLHYGKDTECHTSETEAGAEQYAFDQCNDDRPPRPDFGGIIRIYRDGTETKCEFTGYDPYVAYQEWVKDNPRSMEEDESIQWRWTRGVGR